MANAGITFELLGDAITGQARHHDVQQNQVGQWISLQKTQGLLAAIGGLDPIFVLQQLGDQHQVVGGIIDHQNGR